MSAQSAEYGLLAEFETSRSLLQAAHATREAGYHEVEAYSPFPVEGLAEAVGFRRNRVALIALVFGILGGLGGYFLQWYTAVIDYPFNVGGRPYHSWPAFMIVTLEMTILSAAVGAFVGMLIMNRLPRLRHPLFNAKPFDQASSDRFFLCIKASDPEYRADTVKKFLSSLNPLSITEVLMD